MLLVFAAAACTGTPSPTPRTSVPGGVVYPRCPPKAPPEGTLSITGHAKPRELVPGSPQTVTVCRYAPLPSQRLARSAHVPAPRKPALQSMLNALKPAPKGPFSCPLDRGDIDLILVRYGPTNTIPIKVSISGCRFANNRFGQAYETTPQLRTALEDLVGA